jgi:hypothetical protein
MERAVALYASDLPTDFRYRASDDARLCDWIVQGADRLGAEALHHSASGAADYLLWWVRDQATASQTAAHVARFPDQARFNLAQRMASAVTMWVVPGMSQAALDRGSQVTVEELAIPAVAA